MNDKEIQGIVESRYNRLSWQKLLHGVFGAKVKFFAAPTTLTVEKAIASEAVYLGDVTLQDDHKIAVYEVHLSEHVNIERNRAGIRNLLCSQWRGAGFVGAFMLCYRNSESVLRFSYVSESWAFNEEGAYKKESTDALRFTYLLGEGHHSRTAVQQFMELSNSGLTLKDVTKAFSVEALSKRFFNEYKEKYEDIVEYVTGKRVVKSGNKWETKTTGTPNKKIMAQFAVFADPEKAVRDYVKKLMGRLVFIQFLQKKGWMGVPANDSAWKNGDKDFVQNLFKNTENKDSFIDDVLEPLFDDLNTKRENDLVSSEMVGNNIKVPYLNGGLFEKDAQDNTEFPLPQKFMEGLLEFFTQYNFTIDENDPDDAEVGVDPEMLSCIFENLLEDNKEKGAFYTPKEIVQYMCRESLIAHLCNGVKKNETKERIREFVLTHKVDFLKESEDISESVDEKLKNVKICDPAIGSGAFPMGLMRELYFCRSAIEGFDHAKAAEIKKHIIQQNIYGVDIEKGAVDIARLRFWLSLIVDEETPHALPNLDFKIMQGNSLLEQYEGVELSDITYKATKKEKVSGKILDLFDTGEVANKKVISLLKDEFFNCEDHEMKRQIREALKSRIQDLLREKGFGVKLDAIKDVTATDQFFLWHTWFSEVFEQGGFDIVIGNPPYFKYEGNHKGEIETLKKQKDLKSAFGGKLNAYKLFLAKALSSLIVNNGIICFIFQNSFLGDKQATLLRKEVFENAQIISIDSYPERDNKKKRVFESVKMSVCIPIIKKIKSDKAFVVYFWDDKNKKSGNSTIFTKNDIYSIDSECCTIPRIKTEYIKLLKKLKKFDSLPLKCYEGELNMTFHKSYFTQRKSNPKILKGAAIQRFYFTEQMSQGEIEYLDENAYLSDFGGDKAYHHEYDRIAMQGMTGANDKVRIIMSIVPKGIYLANSCNYLLPSKEFPVNYLLALMNSKIINWYFRCFSTNSNVNGYEIESLPVPKTTVVQQQPIITLVDKILAAKKANPQADTSDLEHQIDQLVYKLYNLTPDEIAVIEGSNNV
jgi:Alw26I/Eco31I/Esp3I family type II restriction m6 adenine DNA methyltransferase